jgi:hypothetical protein
LFLSLLPLKSLIEAVIHRVTLLKLLTTARAVLLNGRQFPKAFEGKHHLIRCGARSKSCGGGA